MINTIRSATVWLLAALVGPLAITIAGEKDAATPVDHVKPRPRPRGILATTGYRPAAAEAPFFERLPSTEKVTGNAFADYSIQGKKGVFVGWFGIVRKVVEDPTEGTTRLRVEQRYFDGLTDSHQQIVSALGSGDYRAVLRGRGLGVKRSSLVKVYGVVASEKDGVPTVTAEFVRHFDWGTFAFMSYGKDRSNPEWRKLNTLPLDKSYSGSPSTAYYEARLGPRDAPSLFERLGGEAGLGKIAADFFGRLRKSEVVNGNSKIREGWAKIGDDYLVSRFTTYLNRIGGGPDEVSGAPIERALAGLAITEVQWAAVVEALRESLEAGSVAAPARSELLDRIAKRRASIVVAKDDGK